MAYVYVRKLKLEIFSNLDNINISAFKCFLGTGPIKNFAPGDPAISSF